MCIRDRHWMLNKMGGVWAPHPSCGPHKMRECLPLLLIIRNRLKYALTNHEVKMICMQRLVKVDGKIRTDSTFPAGFMGGWFGCCMRDRCGDPGGIERSLPSAVRREGTLRPSPHQRGGGSGLVLFTSIICSTSCARW